ncbi:MAG: hypothetical protein RBU30_08035 [Polyangia bacterium]|jgi:hypothetical protein|nr:hypothetical protein [Polyangia bacterium]
MTLTAADLLRIGLTIGLLIIAYGRLSNLLRFLFPSRVRHKYLVGAPEPEGPVAEELRRQGFKYLGGRLERVLGLHARVAAVYAHPSGRVVDLPFSGRLAGGYVLTLFEGDRCALTRVGAGRDVIADRYRSRAVGRGMNLREVLEVHAESEAAISLGHAPVVVEDMSGRHRQARRWYQEHARTELVLPAGAEGLLLGVLVAFGVYLWTL